MRYIFGPVPSRRLGISLGVDLVPYKTCTFNCIYCQLGRTTNQTLKRKEYVNAQDVLKELSQFLKTQNSRSEAETPTLPLHARRGKLRTLPRGSRVPSGREANSELSLGDLESPRDERRTPNYITLSGSGEPTLNSKIGEIISGIKKMTSIPVAVLTNGSLLYRKEVRNNLKKADLVVPSLDAVSAKTFKRINRPVKSLGIEKIVKGLMDFRKEYGGKIWLEVMLVKEINDRKEEIEKLKRAIAKIKPDRVQLNTVARPPCESFARGLNNRELERIKNLLGPPAEIIINFERKALPKKMKDLRKEIITVLKRRPATVKDLADGLGVHRNEVLKYLALLEKEKRVKLSHYRGKRYYQAL